MYLQVDEGFLTHRKTLRFCGLMQDPNAAIYILRLWTWAVRSQPDGDLTGMSALEIEYAVSYRSADGKCFDAMIRAGFIDHADGGATTIHDWSERTGAAVAAGILKAKQQSAYRAHKARTCGGVDECEICRRDVDKRQVDAILDAVEQREATVIERVPELFSRVPEQFQNGSDLPAERSNVDVTKPNQTKPNQDQSQREITDMPISSAPVCEAEPVRTEYPAAFQEIWTYAHGRGSKFKALKTWERLGRPGLEVIRPGWDAYSLTERVRSGFVQDFVTWLNGRGWEQDWPPGISARASPAEQRQQRTLANLQDYVTGSKR